MIINPHVYWNTINSKPFISSAIPIMNEHSHTLSMLIRNESISYCPKTTHADAYVKSIKSSGGVEKLRMFNFLDAATFDSMK